MKCLFFLFCFKIISNLSQTNKYYDLFLNYSNLIKKQIINQKKIIIINLIILIIILIFVLNTLKNNKQIEIMQDDLKKNNKKITESDIKNTKKGNDEKKTNLIKKNEKIEIKIIYQQKEYNIIFHNQSIFEESDSNLSSVLLFFDNQNFNILSEGKEKNIHNLNRKLKSDLEKNCQKNVFFLTNDNYSELKNLNIQRIICGLTESNNKERKIYENFYSILNEVMFEDLSDVSKIRFTFLNLDLQNQLNSLLSLFLQSNHKQIHVYSKEIFNLPTENLKNIFNSLTFFHPLNQKEYKIIFL